MQVVSYPGAFLYKADSNDWHLYVENGNFEIRPQVGVLIYGSGVNLDTLSDLIASAKVHALANGINWSGN